VADNVKKLPGDVGHLQRLIGNHATDRRMPPARLQRWLNAMIVTAVLDRVRDEDDEPIFLLKGGLAMELRLHLRARATNDYDAAFRARAEEVIDHLDEALAQPWNNFNLTRDEPEIITNTKAVRVRLRLSYKGRSWGSVQMEMAPVEGKMGLGARSRGGHVFESAAGTPAGGGQLRLAALSGCSKAPRLH
jgi:hypothetical protein